MKKSKKVNFRKKNGKKNKSVWWMPRHLEPKKDVTNNDMPRGAVSKL